MQTILSQIFQILHIFDQFNIQIECVCVRVRVRVLVRVRVRVCVRVRVRVRVRVPLFDLFNVYITEYAS